VLLTAKRSGAVATLARTDIDCRFIEKHQGKDTGILFVQCRLFGCYSALLRYWH
jgi:hypothetical protein